METIEGKKNDGLEFVVIQAHLRSMLKYWLRTQSLNVL